MSDTLSVLQRVIACSAWLRERTGLAYGLSVAMFAASLYARILLMDVLPLGFPYLTFFPAVILTTFFCGTRPGILCAVLSGLAAWYWFISPDQPLSFNGSNLLALGFYAVIVAVDIALIHFMQQAGARMRLERQVTRDLYEQQTVMFTELQHRVANNMQFISSILYVGKQNVQKGADPLDVLNEAQQRLQSISRIHRRLYDPSRADLPASTCLAELCEDLLGARGVEHIRCIVEPGDIRLDLSRLTTLSMLVAELVTNALKHAFSDGQPGVIRVSLQRTAPSGFCLRVSDDGKGYDGTNHYGTGATTGRRSLGMKIIGSFAAQLGSTATWRKDNGTVVEVLFG